MARMRRASSLLATTLIVLVSVLSLLASVDAASTCKDGPQDTTCTTQDLCSGVSTCCYLTGVCRNSQQANCQLGAVTDPRFPPGGGDDFVNQPENNDDGCVCVGTSDKQYPNPNLLCDELAPCGASQRCWGTLHCDGVGTCKDTGYCSSGNSGAYTGGLCIQNGSSGTFKYCGDNSFVPVTPTTSPTTTSPSASLTQSPSSSPSAGPTSSPTPTPTRQPTVPGATGAPTPAITGSPSSSPSRNPTLQPTPTNAPSASPSFAPSAFPTPFPTSFPTGPPTVFINQTVCAEVFVGGPFVPGPTTAPTRSVKKAKLPKNLKKGMHVKFTQTIVSKVDPILMDNYWTFYLPNWAVFGKVHTNPKTLSYRQAERREEKRAKEGVDRRNPYHLLGTDGNISKADKRGSLYNQFPQELIWNIGPLVSAETYKISFKIKIIATPPPGTTDVGVISIFEHLVMAEVGEGLLLPIIDCEIDIGATLRPQCPSRG